MAKIKWSKGPEEWYCSYGKCCNCNTEFMCSKAHYCPGCGEKIEEEESTDKRKIDITTGYDMERVYMEVESEE